MQQIIHLNIVKMQLIFIGYPTVFQCLRVTTKFFMITARKFIAIDILLMRHTVLPKILNK